MTFVPSSVGSLLDVAMIHERIVTFTAEKSLLLGDAIRCILNRIIYNCEQFEFRSCLLFEGFQRIVCY
jgi:hypothetical protein